MELLPPLALQSLKMVPLLSACVQPTEEIRRVLARVSPCSGVRINLDRHERCVNKVELNRDAQRQREAYLSGDLFINSFGTR